MTGCTALPVAMSCLTVVETWALGIANPTPMLPLCPLMSEPGARAIAVASGVVSAEELARHEPWLVWERLPDPKEFAQVLGLPPR